MTSIETGSITIYLGGEAHKTAKKFAVQQSSVETAKQIYLNTLAVYAIHDYLKLLNIETDLQSSHSWNPFVRAFSTISDLMIPDAGRVICCPILPDATTLTLASKVEEDQIGYVGVQFGQQLDKVQLIGFISNLDIPDGTQLIPVEQLRPLEDLIDRIYDSWETNSETIECFRQWLEGNYGRGWQEEQQVLTTQWKAGNRNRNSDSTGISRAKLIQLDDHVVALLITVILKTENEFTIQLRLYPAGSSVFLPIGTQLTILDEEQNPIPKLDRQLETEDNSMTLELGGEAGDRFSVRISIGENSVTENFMI